MDSDFLRLARRVKRIKTASSERITGEMLLWPGSAAPQGWLLCNGTAVSRTAYAALYAVIGTAYGSGDGGTTFNLPDLKGRVPVGYQAADTAFDRLGETGGAKTHTLAAAEMPSHTHTQYSHNHAQDAHRHTVVDGTTGVYGTARMTTTGYRLGTGAGAYIKESYDTISNTVATNQPATAANQYTGGGGAHNNLQPYLVLNYIIKY
jgi:Microcystin-dependent protein